MLWQRARDDCFMEIGSRGRVLSGADAPAQFALNTASVENEDDLQDVTEILAERRKLLNNPAQLRQRV